MEKRNRKEIVCLGGGNAMPKTVLQGLKKYPIRLSAVCAMLDSGGSTGRLRKDYNISSPGDIRRSLLALSNTSTTIEGLFNYRFQTGELKGHNFANILIAALELSSNNYEKTLKEIKKILNIKHQVFPATLDKANLYAVLENNKIIKGETDIDVPKHNGNLKIKRVFLKPEAKAYQGAVKAIKKADLVVIGPGDLYSSIAQILLIKGISQAIQKSKGKIVYVCNLMTKFGETNNFSVLDFTNEIEKLIGRKLDYVIYNKGMASNVKEKHPELINPVKVNKNLDKKKFIGKNLFKKGSIDHDHKKIAKILLNICKA